MPMKPTGNGLELAAVPAGLLALMLVVMWIQRPDASCTPSVEASRLLVLGRATDREHLAADLASADRIARRYMLSTDDRDQQRARLVECEATLVHEIAVRHGLSPDQVRANPVDAAPPRQSAQWW
jgi:hypothetical protein